MNISPNLKYIFAELSHQRRLLATSVLLMLVGAAIEPAIPALMKPLLDETIPNRDHAVSLGTPALILLAFLAKGVIDYLANITAQKISQNAVHRIRTELFAAISRLPFTELRKADPGFYASKMLNDVGSISGALSTVWVTLVKDTLVIIFLLAYLLYLSWPLTLLILVSLPLAAWIVQRSSEKIRQSSRNLQGHSSNLNSALVDYFSLTGLRDIFSLGVKNFARERVQRLSRTLADESLTLARRQAVIVPLVQIVAAIGVTTAIALAVKLPLGLNTSGDFVAFMAAMAMIFEPVKRLTNLNTVIQRGLVGVESVRSILSQAIGASKIFVTDGSEHSSTGSGLSLKLNAKSFGGPILVNCNLDLVAGEFVGIRGASGTGKTTLALIASGLDQDFDGHLQVADSESTDLSEANSSADAPSAHHLEPSLAGVIYLGPQPMIFSDTLANNVSFGLDLSEGRQHTRTCLETCSLGYLGDHLEQMVGPGGRILSAGEAQRLAIARALFFRPRFVVLDEATGSMDESTETAVMTAFREALPDIGGVIISHRESTYKFAEKQLRLGTEGLVEA